MMIRLRRHVLNAAVLSGSLAAAGIGSTASADAIEEGKAIAFDRAQGNCLACHMIVGGEAPGTIGPPLVAMQTRYPDKAKLRAQIWDATVANPNTAMPPFGRNEILTEAEIDKVVDFIWTL
jgi:sulfur-oxidizing protein SoxX